MKVESLFIDEGFGALDAETLRVAMDALESLHTQGRKIGVISQRTGDDRAHSRSHSGASEWATDGVILKCNHESRRPFPLYPLWGTVCGSIMGYRFLHKRMQSFAQVSARLCMCLCKNFAYTCAKTVPLREV